MVRPLGTALTVKPPASPARAICLGCREAGLPAGQEPLVLCPRLGPSSEAAREGKGDRGDISVLQTGTPRLPSGGQGPGGDGVRGLSGGETCKDHAAGQLSLGVELQSVGPKQCRWGSEGSSRSLGVGPGAGKPPNPLPCPRPGPGMGSGPPLEGGLGWTVGHAARSEGVDSLWFQLLGSLGMAVDGTCS